MVTKVYITIVRCCSVVAFFVCALMSAWQLNPVYAQESQQKQSVKNNSSLPVRIYVLVGQSNMQGKGSVEGEDSNSLRYTIAHDTDKEYQFVINEDGSWRERSDVWIHLEGIPPQFTCGGLKPGYGSHGGVIGPELGFGHKIGDAYEGQVLLIKTCWGGQSLGYDFLPPSMGKYTMPRNPGESGHKYYKILQIVREVTTNIKTYFPDYNGQGIEIAGLCYHQGWNDQYGGLEEHYETNLVAFINDIRSVEHGLGVPNLPIVIATSGMIEKETPIKDGQRAMADTAKYPQFAGNVAVVDTDKPYGPNNMPFKFYTKGSPDKVGYHWNNHARSYLNIGIAMAAEMQKLKSPTLPSRLAAYGTDAGVQLTWQLGTEAAKNIQLLRNGEAIDAKLSATQTTFVDSTALPGENTYELVIDMSSSPQQKLTATSTTYVTDLLAARSAGGVMLTWKPVGKFAGYKITRDGKVIAENIAADATSYEDKQVPTGALVTYAVQPTTGKVTPALVSINLGAIDSGNALVYEPFNYYSSDFKSPIDLLGMKGAVGTTGAYFPLNEKSKNNPQVMPSGITFGDLPVMGNCLQCPNGNGGFAIQLDDSLEKAGLLKDGATMWMSYILNIKGGSAVITLQSEDMKDGIGFCHTDREYQTVVVVNGEMVTRRIGGSKKENDIMLVGKFVWGKDGADDKFYPMMPKSDLKEPEPNETGKYLYMREPGAFNIDQSKLKRLVFQKGGDNTFDEIRVGPSYESVIGGGTKRVSK